MYIKVTNRRKTPVPVLKNTIPGNSSIVISITDKKDIAVLNKLRSQNDILYYEVNADGSSGKYITTKTTKPSKVADTATKDDSSKKESE